MTTPCNWQNPLWRDRNEHCEVLQQAQCAKIKMNRVTEPETPTPLNVVADVVKPKKRNTQILPIVEELDDRLTPNPQEDGKEQIAQVKDMSAAVSEITMVPRSLNKMESLEMPKPKRKRPQMRRSDALLVADLG